MTREEGIDLVEKYQNVEPRDLKLFLEWSGMSERDFYNNIESHRNKDIWYKNGNDGWKLKDSVASHRYDENVEKVKLDKKEECNFLLTPSRERESKDEEYILLAKGYIDDFF
jgi:hypothetical protein